MTKAKRTSSHSAPDGKRQDEPGLFALKGLVEQVKHRSVKEVERSVYGFRSNFLDSWTEAPSHAEFYNVIRIISQREGISRHMLGNMSNRENIAYFLGILAGIAYMSRELYTTEMQDNQISSVCSQSETAEKILYCLYTTNGGHGMYHVDLADKVGLTIEQLTEAMIPLLSCRAVAAVGTGSHTFYTVERIGKRYRSKAVCGQEVKRDAENGDAE